MGLKMKNAKKTKGFPLLRQGLCYEQDPTEKAEKKHFVLRYHFDTPKEF